MHPSLESAAAAAAAAVSAGAVALALASGLSEYSAGSAVDHWTDRTRSRGGLVVRRMSWGLFVLARAVAVEGEKDDDDEGDEMVREEKEKEEEEAELSAGATDATRAAAPLRAAVATDAAAAILVPRRPGRNGTAGFQPDKLSARRESGK